MHILAAALALASAQTTLIPLVEPPPTEPLLAIAPAVDGRIATYAFINGQGPFQFLIDTGANRTALSPDLAKRLSLAVVGRATVIGVTGVVEAPLAQVDRLSAGALRLQDFAAPIVGTNALGAADGLIAASDLSAVRVRFDFDRRAVDVQDAARRGVRSDVRLPARFRAGAIVEIAAEYQGELVHAIIDTGSEYTLVNDAFLDLLPSTRTPRPQARVTSVGEEIVEGELVSISRISIGDLAFERVNALATADLEVLRIWGLADRPTIILGMNVLNALDTLTIDYAAQRVGITFRPTAATGSRIRR